MTLWTFHSMVMVFKNIRWIYLVVLYMNTYLLIICFILGEKIKHKKVTCVEGKCKAQNRNIIDACSYICGNPTCDYISKIFCFLKIISLEFSSNQYFILIAATTTTTTTTTIMPSNLRHRAFVKLIAIEISMTCIAILIICVIYFIIHFYCKNSF